MEVKQAVLRLMSSSTNSSRESETVTSRGIEPTVIRKCVNVVTLHKEEQKLMFIILSFNSDLEEGSPQFNLELCGHDRALERSWPLLTVDTLKMLTSHDQLRVVRARWKGQDETRIT